MSHDPYTTSAIDPALDTTTDELAPSVAVEHLKHTRPWVKFCSIIGIFTSISLLIIGSLMTLKSSSTSTEVIPTQLSDYLLAVFYFILATLILIPSIRLSRYEKSITRLIITQNLADLELAIAHQRAFWKQLAIMITLIMLIYMITLSFSTMVLLKS